jgi:dihydrofolate reductase
MGQLIVIEFVSLDGVMQDPDGVEGFLKPRGGWIFRFGREAVAGDRFKLGELMDSGALLLGRKTWQHFAELWPGRSDPFSTRMNRMPKYVVSASLEQVDAWNNSRLLRGDLVDAVCALKQTQDVVVMGSASVAQALMQRDVVDEFRLLVFPCVLGQGERLFKAALPDLVLKGAEQSGAAALVTLGRARDAVVSPG